MFDIEVFHLFAILVIFSCIYVLYLEMVYLDSRDYSNSN
jgi:uncharacterized membrane protein